MAIRNPLTPIALALATLACQAQDAGNTQRITITGKAGIVGGLVGKTRFFGSARDNGIQFTL